MNFVFAPRAHASDLWRILALALLALTIPLAAACGDDDEDDDETPTTGVTRTATTGGGSPTTSPTASGGGGGVAQPGEVNVLGIWGGTELESFEAMVAGYEDDGGTVNFTGTRDITAQLTLQVEGGNPPDVAIPAEVGLFQQFARDGELITLDQCEGLDELIRDNYPQGFIDLGTVDGDLYGFFMKADTKGTIWYNPAVFEENDVEVPGADATWDDVTTLSQALVDAGIAPWSIGIQADAATGWPGTDWIQQLILNGPDGEEVYDGLIDGSIPFTDERVKAAWEQFGAIATSAEMTAQGGATGVIATTPEDSSHLPFQDPPEAAMVALGGFAGGFITAQFPDAEPGTDFDFFTWPGGAITGGANIVYAFNNDPATCSFLTYLAGGEAQQVWVEEGGFTSVSSEVSLDAYPDDIARKQAEQLLEAEVFRFDLDDAIGGALQQAYFAGVTQYLENPDSLDDILAQIEAARGS
jgi:ABC-type glycerol-3-phosphate transport system substrate-binding protein